MLCGGFVKASKGSFSLPLIRNIQTRHIHNSKTYRPFSLVQEHIAKGKPINSEIINSVLLNQKVAIYQKELDELLNLPSVKFDLLLLMKHIHHYLP